MAKGDPAEVFTITEAQRGLSVEQVSRQRRYLTSMIIRTLCVVGAILIPGWPRALFLVAAIVLPYLAVVIANAGRENDEPGDVGEVDPHAYRALPAPTYEITAEPYRDRAAPPVPPSA